jgi:hypothetical protein
MSTTPNKARRGAEGFTANKRTLNTRVTVLRNKRYVTINKMYKGRGSNPLHLRVQEGRTVITHCLRISS